MSISLTRFFNSYRSIYWILLGLILCTHKTLAQEPELISGPMLGYVEMQEVMIWLQTTSTISVEIEYWEKGQTVINRSLPKHHSNPGYDITKVILTNLKPGTDYVYRIIVNGKPLSNTHYEFKTQSLWQWRTHPPDITFALGSCMYINEEAYDRPGKPYGGEFFILENIARVNPDFMIWLGDNVYLREADFFSKDRMNHRYRHTRQTKELQKLLSSTANYAIWDDHDYGPNNSDRNYVNKKEALSLFNAYWANPSTGHDEEEGVFHSFKWADIDFFMTDGRYHRAPNALMDPEKPFLGEKQLQWLQDGLVNSNAPFKMVVFGNQVLNTYSDNEVFALYKKEYEALLGFILKHKINGVVFLSGDRHFSEILKMNQESAYPLYEFTVSPLTAGPVKKLNDVESQNPLRVEGKLTNERNFGMIKVTGKGEERSLIMQNYNNKGELLWEHKINKNELMFKN
jgi:alkaline phosphatase D